MIKQPTPISRQKDFCYWSRERRWLEPYLKTHVTAKQAADILGISRDKAAFLLGRPDVVCPFGTHTRVWDRAKVEVLKC